MVRSNRFVEQTVNHGLVGIYGRRMVETRSGEHRIAGVEPFVVQLTAAKLFAEHVPREFEELHPSVRGEVRSLQILLQVAGDLWVAKILLRRGEDQSAAAQMPDDFGNSHLGFRNENPRSRGQGAQ